MWAACAGACNRSQPETQPSKPGPVPASGAVLSSDEPLSPMETLARVREYRRAGRPSLVERSIVPEQRSAVSELLYAVDRLEQAGEALNGAVRTHLGLAFAEMFDYSQVANIVGVFSRDVELIDQRIEGEAAVVTIQVSGRVPLDEVHLLLRDGQWQITTDPSIPGLAGELGKLADFWFDVSRRVEQRQLTASDLRRELDARQASVARRLKALTQNARP